MIREEEFVFGALERVNMRERSWVSTYRNKVLEHLGVLSREARIATKSCYYHFTCLVTTTLLALLVQQYKYWHFFWLPTRVQMRTCTRHTFLVLLVQTCKY